MSSLDQGHRVTQRPGHRAEDNDANSDDSIEQARVHCARNQDRSGHVESDFLFKENQRLRDSLNERDLKIAKLSAQLVSNERMSAPSESAQWEDLVKPRVATTSAEFASEFTKMKERAQQAEERARHATHQQEILQETLHLHRKRITKLYKKLDKEQMEHKRAKEEVALLREKIKSLKEENSHLEADVQCLKDERLAQKTLGDQAESVKQNNTRHRITADKSVLTSPQSLPATSYLQESVTHSPEGAHFTKGTAVCQTPSMRSPGFSAIKPAAFTTIRSAVASSIRDQDRAQAYGNGSTIIATNPRDHDLKASLRAPERRDPDPGWKDVSSSPDADVSVRHNTSRVSWFATGDGAYHEIQPMKYPGRIANDTTEATTGFTIRSPIETSPIAGAADILRRFEMEQASFRAEMESLKRLIAKDDVGSRLEA